MTSTGTNPTPAPALPERSVSTERVRAYALAGRLREIALVHVNTLVHLRRCQRAKTRSAHLVTPECKATDEAIALAHLPNCPAINWGCCPLHRVLGDEREQLEGMARRYSIVLNLDATQRIEP